MDREKVIEGLRICASGSCEGCPKLDSNNNGRTCLDALMTDAAELLEEQKIKRNTFKVIDKTTGIEANTFQIALCEEWAYHLSYDDMEGWAIEESGKLLLADEYGKFAYADRERFEVKWDG